MTSPIPPDERRCTAKAKSTGNRCKRPAVPGTVVCLKHGGAAPHVQASGQARLREARARAAAQLFGIPEQVDPHQALLDEVHRSTGLIAFYQAHIEALAPEDMVWGDTERIEHSWSEWGSFSETKRGAAVNLWIKLYNEERDRRVRVAKAAIDAGVAERIVRLEEARGAAVARLIVELIENPDLGLTTGQKELARTAAANGLRALAA